MPTFINFFVYPITDIKAMSYILTWVGSIWTWSRNRWLTPSTKRCAIFTKWRVHVSTCTCIRSWYHTLLVAEELCLTLRMCKILQSVTSTIIQTFPLSKLIDIFYTNCWYVRFWFWFLCSLVSCVAPGTGSVLWLCSTLWWCWTCHLKTHTKQHICTVTMQC